MLKRTRNLALFTVASIVLMAGGAYEASTHVGRGWLRGEAFYDGRPTSYWRLRCDEWVSRFDDDHGMQMTTWMLPFEYPEDPSLRALGPPADLPNRGKSYMAGRIPPKTVLTRIRDSMRSKDEIRREADNRFSPTLLRGDPDSRAVLEELATEDKYQKLANVALKRNSEIARFYEEFKKEMALP